ncbi:MAG TPA: heavy metal-associated domain-containing protein [Gemmataceae bacterium]|nr:heavy metal-associated domain-containing protein [Gemmataceae bacterium]
MKQAPLALLCLSLLTITSAAGEKNASPMRIKHQITGLFSTDREQDLREAFKKIPEIKLVSIDFPNAEAICEYVPGKVFPNAEPGQVIQRLDGMLKSASNHTFGVKPLRTVPREKLKRIEIPVAGLDCKACCLAAYEAIYRLEGVETATASFRAGRVTALIDPEKTNRAKLEAALKQRGVGVKSP